MSVELPFLYLITFFFFFSLAPSQQEIIIPADVPLVQEIGATLREWVQIWQKLYVVRVDHSFISTHCSLTPKIQFFPVFFIQEKDTFHCRSLLLTEVYL